MNKKRQKVIYLFLVLLIMLIVAIIGGLAMVLFNMNFNVKNQPQPTPPRVITNTVNISQAVNEKHIELGVKETPEIVEQPVKSVARVVPAVCDGYGPQIKDRPAFKHKATYSAAIQPNHIQFTIYPEKITSSKGEK